MTTVSDQLSDHLEIDFVGELHELDPGQTLTFGRQADLCVDDANQYLHRQLGRFEHRTGLWWLVNTGSRIPLVVQDLTSRSQVTLAPGRDLVLSFPNAVIQFSAGRTAYEIEVSLGVDEDRLDLPTDLDDDGATISIADLPLTDDQRRLILVLAESALTANSVEIELPTNRAAAHRLGWTLTRFNRKLDNVCERLTKAGVSGLRGGAGALATDRRTALVQHALQSGLVTVDDLVLIDPT
jgi:hypothetical protein